MALFSQRIGIRPLQKSIQREAIDDELRNRLWSALNEEVWSRCSDPHVLYGTDQATREVHAFVRYLWAHHYKLPVDTLDSARSRGHVPGYDLIRKRFFACEWSDVYDFLEVVVGFPKAPWAYRLARYVNVILESENAAYRFVDGQIVEITREHEVGAIESAIAKSTRGASEHLSQALKLLSDRKQPDYRNSIKEAISAVEGTCQLVSGEKGATLGQSLKRIKDLHPALRGAFSQLYGYTSDDGGIRHALSDEATQPTFADAKFMLVACSAFVSFLLTKASEQGLSIDGR